MSDRHHYFSPYLTESLRHVLTRPVTLVEAPAGFGKTSAVRHALASVNTAQVFWHTAVHEPDDVAYGRFCRTVQRLDAEAGRRLRQLGYPNRASEKNIALAIRGISATDDVWLVIDNGQFLLDAMPAALWRSFLEIESERVRIVLISQCLPLAEDSYFGNPNILYISERDLALTCRDIQNYFAKRHVQVTPTQAESICRGTKGWCVAVTMCLQQIESGGDADANLSMDEQLQASFWSRLTEGERLTLLQLCLFDHLNLSDIAFLTGQARIADSTFSLLRRTLLFDYDALQNNYYLHDLLTAFLKHRLDVAPESVRRTIYVESGRLYLQKRRPLDALACFYAADDFASILAAPLDRLEYAMLGETPFIEAAAAVLDRAEADVKARYPLSLLRLAYYFFNRLDLTRFHQAMQEAKAIIDAAGDPQLRFEWLLMSAFYVFPDLDKMRTVYLDAAAFMQHPSALFTPDLPYLFGNPSMWFCFYQTPGQGDAIGERLTAMLDVYLPLTGGHGAGADALYKGELATMRCRFQDAEAYAHEAAYAAETAGQPTVAFGVALLLGRIAIAKSDMAGLAKAIQYLETTASAMPQMRGTAMNDTMLGIVRGMLLSMIERIGDTPDWTKNILFTRRLKGIATLQLAYVHITRLMRSGALAEAIGLMDALEKETETIGGTVVRYFTYIGKCLCYLGTARPDQALDYLDRALTLSEKDNLISTFVHYRSHLKPLFDQPAIAAAHAGFIRAIQNQKEVFPGSDRLIFETLVHEPLPPTLTGRETEIAKLAAAGLTNKDISEKLFISEWTVKNHLHAIFEKLAIEHRSQLINLLR